MGKVFDEVARALRGLLLLAWVVLMSYGVYLLAVDFVKTKEVQAWLNSPPACSYRAEPQGDGTYKLYRC